MAFVAKNEDFIAAEQWVHQAIANKSKDTKSIWRSQVETGTFEYGRGYMMKKHAFYGGKEIMDATGDWDQLKAPADRASDADACTYTPPVVGYGFEEKLYTLYETTRRTETICLRDIVFNWQFENQLKMIFNNLADITLGVWEKFLRETYINFATKLIVAEGMPMFTVEGAVNANGVQDNAGMRTLNVVTGSGSGANANASGVASVSEIGLMTQDVLDYQYQYLARQAHMGKCADGKGGLPVFSLVTSFETSTEIVETNDKFRTDRRYINQEYLLEGYGTIDGFKNWAHIHDLETPRYKLAADGQTLERVYPFEFTPTNIGDQCNINKEYVRANFELSIALLKNVFRGLIPENPTSVAGATFGGCSNLGEFKWLNIQSEDKNLLGENGYMFARYNASPEPLDQVDNALVMLHRRNSGVPITLPDDGTEGGVSTDLTVLSVANVLLGADSNYGGIPGDDGEVGGYWTNSGGDTIDGATGSTTQAMPTKTDEIEVVLSGSFDVTVGGTAEMAGTGTPTDKTVTIVRDYGNDSNRYRLRFVGASSEDVTKDWATIISNGNDWTFNAA